MKNILIIGGNGKIAKNITELAVKKGLNVSSVVRSADQKDSISNLGANPYVLDLKSAKIEDYRKIINEVKPDIGIFAAGANTAGNFQEIDYGALKNFTKSLIFENIPQIFNISTLGAGGANERLALSEKYLKSDSFVKYLDAKTEADEFLNSKKNDISFTIFRPSALVDDEVPENVSITEETPIKDKIISRMNVAKIMVEFFSYPSQIKNKILYVSTGKETVNSAVSNYVK